MILVPNNKNGPTLHMLLTDCWFIVGAASQTMYQHGNQHFVLENSIHLPVIGVYVFNMLSKRFFSWFVRLPFQLNEHVLSIKCQHYISQC